MLKSTQININIPSYDYVKSLEDKISKLENMVIKLQAELRNHKNDVDYAHRI